MRTVLAHATIKVRRQMDKAFELQLFQGCVERHNCATLHRLDSISSMVALLAHSLGAGFSNLVVAYEALLAGRRRHPEVLLYGWHRRGNAELRAARAAQDLA